MVETCTVHYPDHRSSATACGAASQGDAGNAPGTVTALLIQARDGNRAALDQLVPLVYTELRRLAWRQLRRERRGHTLGVSGVVNEAYVKLVDQGHVDWQGREHFFGVAARAMRQVLVDYARRRNAAKRGCGVAQTSIGDKQIGVEAQLETVISLGEALDLLGEFDDRMRRIVEYRYFCGLGEQETAELLGLSVRTVQRDWIKARAWLYQFLYENAE